MRSTSNIVPASLAAVLAGLALLTACESSTAPPVDAPPEADPAFIEFTVLGAPTSGERLSVFMESLATDREIWYNLCLEQEYERWDGERWRQDETPRQPGVCTLGIHGLAPGETRIEEILPPILDPGIYRVVFGVVSFDDDAGESPLPREDRTSRSFQVQAVRAAIVQDHRGGQV